MLGEITGRAKGSTLKGLLQYFEQAILTGSGWWWCCGHGKERSGVGDAGMEMHGTRAVFCPLMTTVDVTN